MSIFKKLKSVFNFLFPESEVPLSPQQDSNKSEAINNVIKHYADLARSMGKYTAFSLIAAAWSVSYIDLKFVPDCSIKVSLTCSILFIVFEYLYLLIITILYKWIQYNYYKYDKDKGLTEVKDPTPFTKKISYFGSIQIIINTLLLGVSATFLIIHIL